MGPGLAGPVVCRCWRLFSAASLRSMPVTFRMNLDELCVVMRFYKVVRQELPGLHFRMPHPVDEVAPAESDLAEQHRGLRY